MTFTRREFLRAFGLATAWTMTAKAESERSASNIVRVGIIGTGVRGKYLIGNLPPSVTVGAICDCASLRIASVMEPKGEFAKVLAHFTDLLWRGWDLFRDYSGHLMTNWGAHSVDMVQLALGRDDTGPIEVRVVEPNSVADLWPHWKSKTPTPVGDSTTSTSDRRFWPVTMKYADGIELHFTPCRNGVPLNATVEVGHRTVTICHLANIARELNRPLRWNPETEQFVDDKEANEFIDRSRRNGFSLP
jgi:hypothetical protein